jgi:hypothetical protein
MFKDDFERRDPSPETGGKVEEQPTVGETGVRVPEKIKAYAVGRYVDPADPNVMHERHVVYRKEASPVWNTAYEPESSVIVGPVMGPGDRDFAPGLLQPELALELVRQRKINSELQSRTSEMIEAGASLRQRTQEMGTYIESLNETIELQADTIETLQNQLRAYVADDSPRESGPAPIESTGGSGQSEAERERAAIEGMADDLQFGDE